MNASPRLKRMVDEAFDGDGAPPLEALQCRPLDLRALSSRQAPPREWCIDQWMPRRGRLLIAGAGGSGKSLLAQQTATAQAIGRGFIGTIEGPCPAMVWNCEDDEDELWRRQEDISAHFGIALDEAADHLTLVSRMACDNILMAPVMKSSVLAKTNVFEQLRQQVNDLGVESLYLDNVAHVFGGDENSRSQVTSFINALASIVTGRPFSVVLIAHTARQAGSEFAGSAAWENAVRMRWFFGAKLPDQRDEDDAAAPDVRYLAKRKANYAAQDHVRMTLRRGALVPDQAQTHVGGLLSANDDRIAEDIVVAGYRSLVLMGIAPTDAKNSGDFLPRALTEKGLAGGYSKGDLLRATNRLMGRGVFSRGVVGQYANRSPKQGLILSGAANS